MARYAPLTLGVASLVILTTTSARSAAPAIPPKELRLDRQGDPLPSGAIARLGAVRLQPGCTVNALLFSRDGKLLFSAGHDGMVRLWDTATGKEVRRFLGFASRVECLALSPDGRFVAAAGATDLHPGPPVRIWETATGKPVPWSAKHDRYVNALAFTPDGKALVTAEDPGGALRLLAFPTGKQLREFTTLDQRQRGVLSLAFSTDGKLMLSGSKRGPLCLWRVATGDLVRILPAKKLLYVALTGDGKTFASTNVGEAITLRDTATGKAIRQLKAGGEVFVPIAFSPDGRTLVSGSNKGIVQLWDMARGKELHRMTGHNAPVQAVAFSPDSKTVASGGRDQRIRLWDVATGRERRYPEEGHHSIVWALAFSPDGQLLASGGADNVCLWDVPGRKLLRQLEGHSLGITNLVFSPDGKQLASVGAEVRLWDVASGKELQRFPSTTRFGAASAAFSPDGKRLAISWHENGAQLVDVATGKSLWKFQRDRYTLHRLQFSADGEILLAMVQGKSVGGWSAATGAEVYHAAGETSNCYYRAVAPDGRSATTQASLGSSYDDVCVWEMATGKERARLPASEGVLAFSFSPDGMHLAGALHSSPLVVWNLSTRGEIARLPGHSADARSLAFSPDGRTLASGGSEGSILLWDMARLPVAKRPARRVLPPRTLDLTWEALQGPNAARAYRALWTLRAVPDQALPLLRRHLRPIAAPDPKHVARLVAALDSDDFDEREKATAELAKLGSAANAMLAEALKTTRSTEVRKRLTEMLDKCRNTLYARDRLRALRMLELLERLGTAEAAALLKTLAANKSDVWLAREATAAHTRLRRQAGGKP